MSSNVQGWEGLVPPQSEDKEIKGGTEGRDGVRLADFLEALLAAAQARVLHLVSSLCQVWLRLTGEGPAVSTALPALHLSLLRVETGYILLNAAAQVCCTSCGSRSTHWLQNVPVTACRLVCIAVAGPARSGFTCRQACTRTRKRPFTFKVRNLTSPRPVRTHHKQSIH